MSHKVTIVGSGNWGSAIGRLIAMNVRRYPAVFDSTVRMWVHEEQLEDGRLLSHVINGSHENVKYLPGVLLPDNVLAITDLRDSVAGSSMLVFVTPHQFVRGICGQLRGVVASSAKAISLIKGVDFADSSQGGDSEGAGTLRLVSDTIKEELGLQEVHVLMGANIANEVARDQFCESTLGYDRDLEGAQLFAQLLQTPFFQIATVRDIAGVELCGALKNIVALGAGFVDGLGLGENSKAAIIRIGLQELRRFAQMCYSSVQTETFWESCGVADLLTTCYGGRNRRVAEAYAKANGAKSIDQLESEMLGGQKLQGPPAAREAYRLLQGGSKAAQFPLFASIYHICFEHAPPSSLIDALAAQRR